jgi:heat shock protein HslJ
VSAHYVRDTVGAGAIAVGRLKAARGGCDARVQLVQTHILDVLQSVSSFSIAGDVLTMSGSGGTLVLRAAEGTAP